MKFSIKKADIQDVLSKVQGMTGRKSSLAITESALIQAVDNGVALMVTDLESGFEGTYSAQIEEKGAIAVNARKLYEIVRDFPSEEIFINEVENRWIEIGHANVLYHIVGMNPDDFPTAPKIEEINFFEISSLKLKKMIEKTVMIAGPSDDKRAHILGLFLERTKNKDDLPVLRMVSTDGSRLTMMESPFEGDGDLTEGAGVLIPKKGLYEIGKFLDIDGTVQIGVKQNHFIVKKEFETIIVRLLEGDFPAYEQIINKADGKIISLDRTQFLMMLRRMSILSSEDYKAAIFNFSKDKLLVSASNPEIGESKEDISIEFDSDPLTIAYNPKFFIDILNVIESKNVQLYLIDEERPCLVYTSEDDSFLSAIMPMRI